MTIWGIAGCIAFIIFIAWVVYVQIAGWRTTRGYRGNMEMTLIDRFHDEVVYQLCYKRGYKVDLELNDESYWAIKKTDHPGKKRVKMIVLWATIQILFRPYSFRTVRVDDFDDFDLEWSLEE